MARSDRHSPLFTAYRLWLVGRCGLTETTWGAYRPVAQALVREAGSPSRLRAGAICAFVLRATQGRQRSVTRSVVTGVRSFLRFLAATGRCSPLLVAAVPSVAKWRLASLPRYLPPSSVDRLIGSCPHDSLGVRDRAILLLMARLGLRRGDVRSLQLKDLDFQQATLRVCGKGRSEALLPLPQDVGDAVLRYIETARPKTTAPALFLSPRASRLSPRTISALVAKAGQRVGIAVTSHRLRHSAAFRMLHEGASLEAIGAVLRHRSPVSTATYAKVDLRTLRLIAQPWPEVTP